MMRGSLDGDGEGEGEGGERGRKRRTKVLVAGLMGMSLERAVSWGELELVVVRHGVGGAVGGGDSLVSEPSGFREILRNL